MRKSSQVLIILSAIIIAVAVFSKITGEGKTDKPGSIKEYTQSLINVDRDFYKVSAKKGLGRAFIDFADDSVILLRDKQFPIWGRAELAKHHLNHESEVKPLYWDPVKAEASPDGKLGYTFGKWEYKDVDKDGKSTSEYGDYLTVWKKQKDGSWKYVYDGGGSTPGPLTR
jgi:ketosteroid isomerase-like protein